MNQTVDERVAKEHGLTPGEWQHVLSVLGRTPTIEELGMISVLWSEHCSYKSSKVHLRTLPTEAPWVIQGPGENAGVIDVGHGLAVAFKMESHNHPSFIEPYQGAATGVGGIMRDVFTMGARPIANMNSLRFGEPKAPRMRFLVEGVVAGIGGYGNCMGVPTVGGEVAFDESYNGNILVNAFTLGVLPKDRVFLSQAAGVGNPLVYVGSKTGRDGIHGATMASEEFTKDSEAKRPRVQVGDPFTEKVLLEACLELMKQDVIVAIQDMGAAGLTSSSAEMASRGGLGVELHVDRVPRREAGMTPYEVLLSESQERMLMVVKKGHEDAVHRIFEKWDLSSAVVGVVTDTQHVVVKDEGRVVVDLPVALLVDEAPLYQRPMKAPEGLGALWAEPSLGSARPGAERLLQLLARPTIASKRWVYEQYDHSVRAGTVLGPGEADAAVLRLPNAEGTPQAGSGPGVALTVDMNGRYCRLDPYRGAALGVLESVRNLACVGAEAKALTDCLNFGNPEKPEVMWSFAEAVRGLGDACRALHTPVVSGNVSLYNETEGRPILPTPTVAVVGVVEDVSKTARIAFPGSGHLIFLLGDTESLSFAGSELQLLESGGLSGRPPEPDFERARAVHAACIEGVRSGLVKSAHDAAEGGLAVALAESLVAAGRRSGSFTLGAKLRLPGADLARAAFAEGPSLILVTVAEAEADALRALAARHRAPIAELGRTNDTGRLQIDALLDVPVEALADAHEHGLERALELRAPDA